MLRITIRPHWRLGHESESTVDTTGLLELLAAVQDTGSLAQGARTIGWSYRHAWGQVKQAEALFGAPLIETGRGRGSTLTEVGLKLIWADRRIAARLSPLLESLASELEAELERTLARDKAAVLRLNASHGFAVATLVEQLEAAGIAVELRYRNSLESVAALSRGECELAGFHVPMGELEGATLARYLPWLRPDQHRLLHLAYRTQGLFLAPGNPKNIRSLEDLTRDDVRFVNRPEGSGTRVLTELLLARHGIASPQVTGYDDTELTHAAVAAYIASGMADAGIGVQTAATRFGLHFIPLLQERYFFALSTSALKRPQLQPALALLQSPALRSAIAALRGYDARDTGRMLSIPEAFPDCR